ncbi:MAG: DUF6516 family protein [Pseudomonadota bacterium]
MKYFDKVRRRTTQLKWIIERETVETEYDEDAAIGMIGGSIHFKDGSVLYFKDLIFVQHRDYRFHYMDRNQKLICRWDTAPHHHEIKTFPYHQHTPKKVMESEEVNLIEVLDIVEGLVIETLDRQG